MSVCFLYALQYTTAAFTLNVYAHVTEQMKKDVPTEWNNIYSQLVVKMAKEKHDC